MTNPKPTARCWCVLVLVAWSAIAVLFSAQPVRADRMEDEYVRQVIEEDQQHYYNGNDNGNDADAERMRREAEERSAKDAADRLASERERQFQREIDRMGDDDDRKKKALKQKKQDGRRVRSVLRASRNNNLYKVLGLGFWETWALTIPPRTVHVAGFFSFTIPGLTLLGGATDSKIRKQFRKRAVQVHPDKNKDGRAREAFVEVENAAAILSDPKQRKTYDAERKLQRDEKLESSKKIVATSVEAALALTRKSLIVVRTLLGPFFLPVVIIGALII